MLRELKEEDQEALLALNNASTPAVNPLTLEELKSILSIAEKCWIEEINGKLVAALIIIGPDQTIQVIITHGWRHNFLIIAT